MISRTYLELQSIRRKNKRKINSYERQIKQEESSHHLEIAYLAKLLPEIETTNFKLMQLNYHHEQQEPDITNTPDTIKQEYLQNIKKEIVMLYEIEINKGFINFYIEEEDTLSEDTMMLEVAMDSVEKDTKLDPIKDSMFFHRLKLHDMDDFFKKLYKNIYMM